MSHVTMLGFIGFCKTDIILYLSRILQVLEQKVAILDMSEEQEIKYWVPVGIYSQDRVDYRGVDVILNCRQIEKSYITDSNILLIDGGINPEVFNTLNDLKALFIVTDAQRHHTVPLSSSLKKISESPDSIRVIRDVAAGKIRPSYIDSILQTEQTTNIIAQYELPFHETEYAVRLICQYDDIFKFTKIPDTMKNMFLECITELFGIDNKTVMKAIRKAMRGG